MVSVNDVEMNEEVKNEELIGKNVFNNNRKPAFFEESKSEDDHDESEDSDGENKKKKHKKKKDKIKLKSLNG